MGNIIFCCPSDHDDNNKDRSQQIYVDIRPPQVQNVTTYRTGDPIADLCTQGFEYRAVRCNGQKHKVATTSCSSSCMIRLVHIQSGEVITSENRQTYIADGFMFKEIARLCQEIVQEKLMREESLKWATLCNDASLGEPVKALVVDDHGERRLFERDHDTDETTTMSEEKKLPPRTTATADQQLRPNLIIVPGKGTSRAGVISTKQLLISDMKTATTQFHLRKAQKRGMNVFLLDTNARGASMGMDTFERSMNRLLCCPDEEEACSSSLLDRGPIYILAHSAGGGQLVRYLLFGQRRHHLIPRIRSIAFTDSTHNIQWARNEDEPYGVFELLQSPKCLYIKNNAVRASEFCGDGCQDEEAGGEAEVDQWWQHRFGNVRTVWAGTDDHSLMCWVAREQIWDHFEKNL